MNTHYDEDALIEYLESLVPPAEKELDFNYQPDMEYEPDFSD